jgi:triphosphoribosyl-dephospho-CoA synthase
VSGWIHDVELCQVACIWEVMARKVGNVHPTAAFAATTATDFLLSVVALGTPFQDRCGRGVGLAVWAAVEATQELVGQNTNLGIALLTAPLIAVSGSHDFRGHIGRVLNSLTVDDAECVYKAIRLANPGGLGDAPEQDVHTEPTVTLLEAMKLAADRDLIARQYANNYADVFDLGVPAFTSAFAKYDCVEAAVISCQLAWMAAFPDSLIARKRGLAVAEDVQRRVRHILSLGGLDTREGRRAGVELDAHLRSDGNKLNPGTTADLVAACLFVALRENKVQPSAPFRWNAPDWL